MAGITRESAKQKAKSFLREVTEKIGDLKKKAEETLEKRKKKKAEEKKKKPTTTTTTTKPTTTTTTSTLPTRRSGRSVLSEVFGEDF